METKNTRGISTGNKKQAQLSDKLIKVLEEAEKVATFEPNFDFKGTGTSKIKLPAIQDPDDAYELYYKSLGKLKRSFVPKGDKGQPIRDEINLFLKRGKLKGADGRQAYTHLMR